MGRRIERALILALLEHHPMRNRYMIVKGGEISFETATDERSFLFDVLRDTFYGRVRITGKCYRDHFHQFVKGNKVFERAYDRDTLSFRWEQFIDGMRDQGVPLETATKEAEECMSCLLYGGDVDLSIIRMFDGKIVLQFCAIVCLRDFVRHWLKRSEYAHLGLSDKAWNDDSK